MLDDWEDVTDDDNWNSAGDDDGSVTDDGRAVGEPVGQHAYEQHHADGARLDVDDDYSDDDADDDGGDYDGAVGVDDDHADLGRHQVFHHHEPQQGVFDRVLWNDFFELGAAEGHYFTPEQTWEPSQFDGVGTPVHDAQFWHQQQGNNSCAVVAQLSIFESITGQHLSEEVVCRMAEERGWLSRTGTSPANVGRILDALGVPTEQHYGSTLADIADALQRGDKVIVGLNANEIWHPVRDAATGMPVQQAVGGHAVWVTGIDPQPDGSVKLILNDSGSPDGKLEVVDAYDFINAWDDYGNFMVVAHPPANGSA